MHASSRRSTGALCALAVAAVAVPCLLAAGIPDPPPDDCRLFRIENSHTESYVAYDARIGADGRLDRRRPVEAYWLLFSKDGRREKLNWVERRFAYGFKTSFVGDDTVVMKMAAGIEREIVVDVVDGVPRATVEIDGRLAVLERIYARSVGRRLWPSVEYLDVFGTDLETGEERSERIVL
jgi:hypothetical protein